MSSAAQELIDIVAALPEDKAREVVDFARFLQQQAGDPGMGTHSERAAHLPQAGTVCRRVFARGSLKLHVSVTAVIYQQGARREF
jgi:hypothetical protein